MIAEMIIEQRPAESGRGFLFNCKHHKSNGDCGVYAMRPRMCSEYPYDSPCDRDGCTCPEKGVNREVCIRWHQDYYFTW